MSIVLRSLCGIINQCHRLKVFRYKILNCESNGNPLLQFRLFGMARPLLNKSLLEKANVKETKAKVKSGQKITLLSQNYGMTITTLEDAMKLAKRRDLQLVQISEKDKSQRPVYKLITQAELLQEDDFEDRDSKENEKEKSVQRKSDKHLTIGSRIAEHDLSSRLKNIAKWLNKNHEVKILLQGSNPDDIANCERIVKTIEQSIKEPTIIGKIVQKRTKGTNLKFNIVPVISSSNDLKLSKDPS